MRYTVFIFPQAVLQLKGMAEYLDEHRTGYGQLFLDEFNDTLEYLENFAHTPAKKRKNFRQVLIGRFKVLAMYISIMSFMVAGILLNVTEKEN